MTDKANDKDKLLNDAIKASIDFEKLMDKTDFDSWLDGACLCSWDEIPENHCELLKKFINDKILIENFEINWVETEKIKEIEEGKAIEVVTKEKSLLLMLNDKKTKFELKIDDGKVRAYEFTVETKRDKLNICFTDSSKTLEYLEQFDGPFKNYEKNKKDLKEICYQMKQEVINNSSNSVVNSSLDEDPISKLFKAKLQRLDARICSNKEDEEKEYNKALHNLLSALNDLQNPEIDNNDKRWLILFYNDLSICYAGRGNSSMSMGYAKEARSIIEEEKTYKEFEERFEEFEKKLDSATLTSISNCDFVTSKLYDLYIVALFNQAQAERRSFSYGEAEKNFKKIIKYAEGKTKDNKITPLRNFNYCSALLNLGDLYIDLGRGREAVELLDKAINKLDEDDIRYWNASIAKINALIDQSKYDYAEEMLKKKFCEKGNNCTLVKRYRVTSTGFKALNCYARCKVEKVRNTLKIEDENKSGELKEAETVIKNNIKIIIKRKQKGLETKAYKQLSDIYKILSQDKEDNDISEYDKLVIDNLIKFISETKINNLDEFIGDSERGKWIDRCDDLDALESFTGQIIKIIKEEPKDKDKDSLVNLLEEINKKITRECEDKDQLSRAERIGKQVEEIRGEKKDIEELFRGKMDSIFPEGSSRGKDNLTRKDICKCLDINERDFDSGFFDRSKMKEKDHIVEVIVLRRWNSFSPGLYRESTGSLGGGYLLRINKKELMGGNDGVKKEENEKVENIVIDPGYNFIQSFRNEGFHVEDIDTIIVTHSHLDHCAELLQIMDLLFQFNKRYKDTPYGKRQRKRVNLCLSKGAYTKFSSFTNEDWQKQLKDVIIIENFDNNKCEPFKGLTISAIPTPHKDLGGVNAIGLKIEIGIGKKKLCLGFTGDTPWSKKIRDKFKGCDLLCVHLGSMKYHEIGYRDDRYNLRIMKKPREIKKREDQHKEFNEKYGRANHLLFFGTLDFIEHCSDKDEPLIIVGEFGEELKYGLRTDLCKKLCREVNEKRKEKKIPDIVCLPGDIGLYVGIDKDETKKVCCNFCEEFVGQKEIMTFLYGREDAIHYICKTCDKTLSELQKQAFIEHRLTRH